MGIQLVMKSVTPSKPQLDIQSREPIDNAKDSSKKTNDDQNSSSSRRRKKKKELKHQIPQPNRASGFESEVQPQYGNVPTTQTKQSQKNPSELRPFQRHVPATQTGVTCNINLGELTPFIRRHNQQLIKKIVKELKINPNASMNQIEANLLLKFSDHMPTI